MRNLSEEKCKKYTHTKKIVLHGEFYRPLKNIVAVYSLNQNLVCATKSILFIYFNGIISAYTL